MIESYVCDIANALKNKCYCSHWLCHLHCLIYANRQNIQMKPFSYAIMGLSLVLTAFLKIDAVFVIIGCGLFGLIWSVLNRKEQSNGTD